MVVRHSRLIILIILKKIYIYINIQIMFSRAVKYFILMSLSEIK